MAEISRIQELTEETENKTLNKFRLRALVDSWGRSSKRKEELTDMDNSVVIIGGGGWVEVEEDMGGQMAWGEIKYQIDWDYKPKIKIK